jgi:3-hydroxybutyryl-CoA dehydrogenase
MTKIGVVGIGNIGTGVVTDLVFHGFNVVAMDAAETALQGARTELCRNIRFAPLLSRTLTRLDPEAALQKVHFTTAIDPIASCDFVIENVTEKWEIKKAVYQQLDRAVPAHVCFGCNTSCLSITRLAGLTTRPDRVVGMHFMNPVHLTSAVEVVRGHHTSEETLSTVRQLFNALKKEAIIVEDLPGFVSNRISHLFMNEAMFVLQDGLADAGQIDAIFKKCFGHKMGPLETADLIGLDTVMHSLDVLYDAYHDPKFRCCPRLRKMVDAGLLGRKSGRGFYTYPN